MKVTWLEMPVAYSCDAAQSVGPKYAIDGSAVVLYKKDRAYVGLARGEAIAALLAHADVHAIPSAEMERLEELSGVSPSTVEHLLKRTGGWGHRIGRAASRVGLGDAVAAITHRLGIRECSGCARRRSVLNRLTIRRWRPRSSHSVPPIRHT